MSKMFSVVSGMPPVECFSVTMLQVGLSCFTQTAGTVQTEDPKNAMTVKLSNNNLLRRALRVTSPKKLRRCEHEARLNKGQTNSLFYQIHQMAARVALFGISGAFGTPIWGKRRS